MTIHINLKKAVIVVLTVILIIALTVTLSSNVSAEEKSVNAVEDYFKLENVKYTNVSVQNGRMYVELQSNDKNRCTLEDVKAIEAVYEAIHAKKVDGIVNLVEIVVKTPEGKILSDETVNVSSTIVEKTDQAIIDDVTVLTKNSFDSVNSVKLESYLDGTKKNIVIKVTDESDDHTSNADGLYRQILNYQKQFKAIDKCEIYVEDINGECLYYITGELEYGDMLAWVSEKSEESFVNSHGPREE